MTDAEFERALGRLRRGLSRAELEIALSPDRLEILDGLIENSTQARARYSLLAQEGISRDYEAWRKRSLRELLGELRDRCSHFSREQVCDLFDCYYHARGPVRPDLGFTAFIPTLFRDYADLLMEMRLGVPCDDLAPDGSDSREERVRRLAELAASETYEGRILRQYGVTTEAILGLLQD